jgi:hypothetical protein
MKQIKKQKNNIKSLLILLVVLLFGIVLLGAIQKKQDIRSSAATAPTCSTKDLSGKVLTGTCTSSGPTGGCYTGTGISGIVVKTSSCYCCVPDNGRVTGAEKCYAAGGACIHAYGIYQNYKDGSACVYGGQSGTFASGLCLGTYGAIDYKCCKLNPTSKPSCVSKGGACVSSVRTCQIAEEGIVVSGTSGCSGSTPVCCKVN